jgi:polygalacturonase
MASTRLQLVFLAPIIALLVSSGALGAAAMAGSSLAAAQSGVFSLDSYGARGDGTHDDAQALSNAWKAACASPRPAVVLVPGGKRYLLSEVVKLSGPCRSASVTLTVQGTLVASPNRADWSDRDRRHWIVFRAVDGLTVNGGGVIDGNGETWWKNSCKINKALVSTVLPRTYDRCRWS